MRRFSPVTFLLLALLTFPSAVLAQRSDFTESQSPASISTDVVIVRLAGVPMASAGLPVSAEDGQIDLATPEAQAYEAQLRAKQDEFIAYLGSVAPTARVTHRYTVVYNGVAVALNGTAVSALLAGPNVQSVSLSRVVRPTMNVSLGLIGADVLWSKVGGSGNAGSGVKVGVIDSGIDQRHPFFADATLTFPKGYPKCDFADNCALTTPKVIVAREYPKSPTYDASDANGHGTHVSGTVAGVHGTTAPGVSSTLSGVAPKAYLGNYNVFPGTTEGAYDVDIIDALEDAVRDRMNVLNMSLGGPIPVDDLGNPIEDPLKDAVNSTVDAGLVVVVAAGNSGPGSQTVSTPGVAEKAITVGATTNKHFLGVPVSTTIGSFGAAIGQFNAYDPAVSAPLANWAAALPGSGEGCEPSLDPNYRGKIVLIRRGTCNFTLKVRNAQNAGAVGVLMINNVGGDPVAMGHDGTEPKPTIPAVMLSKTDGEALRPAGGSATVDGTRQAEFVTNNHDIMAGFSSRGPTMFTYQIKPDLTGPGVNIYSSIPNGGYAFFQGTSMASPHVAGASAVLRQLNPKWKPEDIKSALSSTAKRPVFAHTNGTTPTTVMNRGAGRMDLSRAGAPGALFSPVNVSFGVVQPTSFTVSRTVTVKGTGGKRSYTAAISQTFSDPNLRVTVSPASFTLRNNETATLTLTISSNGLAVPGQYEGDITVTSGGSTQVVPYWIWLTSEAVPGIP